MVSHSNNIQYVKIRISLPTDYIYISRYQTPQGICVLDNAHYV